MKEHFEKLIGIQCKENQSILTQPYEPYRIPPILQISYRHRLATQFGVKKQQNNSFCRCCGEFMKEEIGLCCQIDSIYNINEAVGYYFTYIKVLIGMLFCGLIICGIYGLVLFYENCTEDTCQRIYNIPIPSNINYTYAYIMTNAAFILLMYVLIGYLLCLNAQQHLNLRGVDIPTDYSVMLTGINHDFISKEDILDVLGKDYQIDKFMYTHIIGNYIRLIKKKNTLNAKKNQHFKRGEMQKHSLLQKQKLKVQADMLSIKNKFTMGFEKQLRTDKVFVRFRTVQQKEKFTQEYELSRWKGILSTFWKNSPLMIKGLPVYVEMLGHPHEIIWENLELSSKSRYTRVFISNLCTAIILIISYFIISYLSELQNQDKSSDFNLSIVFFFCIQVTNFLLRLVIQQLTEWQKRYTLTGLHSTTLVKNMLAFFLNTTLIPFSLFIISILTKNERNEGQNLIKNIFTLFIIVGLVTPISSMFLQVSFIQKLYRRYRIRSSGENSLITQLDSDDTFEKMNFELDHRYAVLCQCIMNCLFYAGLFPIGIIITLVGFIIIYWASKLWLLKRCSIPKYSYRLSRIINYITVFFPFIYSAGFTANIFMSNTNIEKFQRDYCISISVITFCFSWILFCWGTKIALKIINKLGIQKQNDSQIVKHFDFYELNPTSFLHPDLSVNSINCTTEQIQESIQKYSNFCMKRSIDPRCSYKTI